MLLTLCQFGQLLVNFFLNVKPDNNAGRPQDS